MQHPLITNDVASRRSKEKVERGLAAYRALRADDAQAGSEPRSDGVARLRALVRRGAARLSLPPGT